MIVCVVMEGIVIVVLALLCRRMYGDLVAMARASAGLPAEEGDGNSRVISPYKRKKEGDTA